MKCFIEWSFSKQEMGVTLYETDVDGRVRAVLVPVELMVRTVPLNERVPAEPLEPTFKFGGRIGDEFLQAIVDAAAERGITPKSADFNAGKMEAMEANLRDLRALLKIDGGGGATPPFKANAFVAPPISAQVSDGGVVSIRLEGFAAGGGGSGGSGGGAAGGDGRAIDLGVEKEARLVVDPDVFLRGGNGT